MELDVKDRISLVVYLYSLKRIAVLKRYGSLQYCSQSMHYVILDISQSRAKVIKKKLNRLNFVENVLDSPVTRLSNKLLAKTQKEITEDDS